jgi:lipopolysaccharide transport system ATP-binding protein
MKNSVISVEHLSKAYRLGQIGTGTLSHDLNVWWAKVRGKPNPMLKIGETDFGNRNGETIMALKDVSFIVEQGEVLGIIGKNGAGKSTLLKILSCVTAPTSGQVRVKGRIASLLEVGTGFHPELTGRENVYLNGAILGMSRKEVDRKFDEIIDFSGVEKFIDTPVKRYSSGMYVRLAFAIAAHLDPETLLVDEVLAVGDAEFQKKCLGKMEDVAKQGRTVLFVSHNMIAVQTLCQSAIWLDTGQLKKKGPVSQVVTNYLQSGRAENNLNERVWSEIATAPGNQTLRIRRISVQPEHGKPGDMITMQTALRIEVEYWNLLPAVILHSVLHIYNDQGILAFTTGTDYDPDPVLNDKPPAGLFRSTCHIPGSLLNSGFHFVNLILVRAYSDATYEMSDAIGFDVIDNVERKFAWYGKEPGVLCPDLPWETEYLGSINSVEKHSSMDSTDLQP